MIAQKWKAHEKWLLETWKVLEISLFTQKVLKLFVPTTDYCMCTLSLRVVRLLQICVLRRTSW